MFLVDHDMGYTYLTSCSAAWMGVCLDNVGGDDMRHCAPWPTSRVIRYATLILNLSLPTMANGGSIF